MGTVNEYLFVILSSKDKRLLDDLDKSGDMLVDTVRRLRNYTTALLDGSITPAVLAEDWDDFYDLPPAFVAACAPEWVGHLETMATFLDSLNAASSSTASLRPSRSLFANW